MPICKTQPAALALDWKSVDDGFMFMVSNSVADIVDPFADAVNPSSRKIDPMGIRWIQHPLVGSFIAAMWECEFQGGPILVIVDALSTGTRATMSALI